MSWDAIHEIRRNRELKFRGDFAIAMGSDTIVSEGQPRAGQTLARRYSNMWMKQQAGGSWRRPGAE